MFYFVTNQSQGRSRCDLLLGNWVFFFGSLLITQSCIEEEKTSTNENSNKIAAVR
uniref:Uncharacterized protein n=1 Tax=Anguilla anguilla TaxID=7936 RepID=A0A0E9R9J4_ANGAN